MSQTISIGVVGPSHWSYMATVMSERLARAVHTKKLSPSDIPVGVYRDAVEFANLALQAAKGGLPDNPPASMNAYVIAADLVRSTSNQLAKTRADIDQCLGTYAEFLAKIVEPFDLNDAEVRTAEALRRFFLRLKQEGESQSYESAVYFEQPFAGSLRL